MAMVTPSINPTREARFGRDRPSCANRAALQLHDWLGADRM